MGLHPFRRSEESLLLTVPGAQDDGAARPPSLLQERSKRTRLFEKRGLAADRILRSIYPRVVVVAVDPPFVGPCRTGNARDNVAGRNDLPIEGQLHMDLRGPRAEVIGERQRTAPLQRGDRTAERGKQRPSVSVRNGR